MNMDEIPPSFPDDRSTPAELNLKLPAQELHVTWVDGQRSVFAVAQLRAVCPCAVCRAERESRSHASLPVLPSRPGNEPRVTDANLVGNYAIQFTWSDGHSAGIFDFRYLRSLVDMGRS